ncbi:MAG: type IX secretion system membrane protein PorP/SprF [Flavobacteriales bacterium TMED191]|nr:MAG: type IX secretion system membrane protein PorP/SprF [Flavobacteriales bacterium TMED191]
MKKYIPILAIIICLSSQTITKGQTLPIYSQYMFNEYLINAAYGGTYAFTPIIMNHRNQWTGFGDVAPKTSSLSAHTAIGQKSSLGGLMIYDQTGPITNTQVQMSYGYHVLMNKESNLILSMALSGTLNMMQFIYQEGMTYSELTSGIIDNSNQNNESSSAADMNFDLVLLHEYFDFGLSIRNLLAAEPTSNTYQNEILRTKYILLHGTFLGVNSTEKSIGIIPSFVLRKMGIFQYNSLFEIDLNVKIIYRNKIWSGLSYRTHENTISTSLGINTAKAFFGYTYDIGTSTNLSGYHNGSHNIAIGFKIFGQNKRSVRQQNPLQLNINSNWERVRLSDMRNKSGK